MENLYFIVAGVIFFIILMVVVMSSSGGVSGSGSGGGGSGSSTCAAASCTNNNTCGESGNCECGTSAACTGNQVCNGTSCVDECTQESCTNNNTCGQSNYCVCGTSAACTEEQFCNGKSCDPLCSTNNCTDGNTCNSATNKCDCNGKVCATGQTCSNGTCLTPSPDHTPCTDGSTCSSRHCYYGKCATPVGNKKCTAPLDCGKDIITTTDCVNGVCLQKPPAYGCSPGCADGYSCENGVCTLINISQDCASDPTTCDSTEVCTNIGCESMEMVFSCAETPSYCATWAGPDSVCTNEYCTRGNSYDTNVFNGYACIGGTLYNTGCSGTDPYDGPLSILENYLCNTVAYTCDGSNICKYGQKCSSDQTCVVDV